MRKLPSYKGLDHWITSEPDPEDHYEFEDREEVRCMARAMDDEIQAQVPVLDDDTFTVSRKKFQAPDINDEVPF